MQESVTQKKVSCVENIVIDDEAAIPRIVGFGVTRERRCTCFERIAFASTVNVNMSPTRRNMLCSGVDMTIYDHAV